MVWFQISAPLWIYETDSYYLLGKYWMACKIVCAQKLLNTIYEATSIETQTFFIIKPNPKTQVFQGAIYVFQYGG